MGDNQEETLAYDEFGVPTVESTQNGNGSLNNPFGFTGYQLDDISGLYFAQARYYEPTNARFVSEDPIIDGLNWYNYCNGNPLSFIDPTGHKAGDKFDSADCAAIDFAMEYTIISAEKEKEYASYIYKIIVNGKTYYTYNTPDILGARGGKPSSYEDFDIKLGDIVAVVHTHGKPRTGQIDNHFSIFDDGTYNSTMGWKTKSFTGLYLAAPNGTVQFWGVDEPISDSMIKVISTEAPIAEGAQEYVEGSEQLYNKVEKTRPWYYYLNPLNWGKPSKYNVYVPVRD